MCVFCIFLLTVYADLEDAIDQSRPKTNRPSSGKRLRQRSASDHSLISIGDGEFWAPNDDEEDQDNDKDEEEDGMMDANLDIMVRMVHLHSFFFVCTSAGDCFFFSRGGGSLFFCNTFRRLLCVDTRNKRARQWSFVPPPRRKNSLHFAATYISCDCRMRLY